MQNFSITAKIQVMSTDEDLKLKPDQTPSPPWGSNTKLIVGLTMVAIVAILLAQFREIVGPLILSFTLAILFHPLASWLSRMTKLPWRASVSVIFFVFVILIAGIFTLAGFAIVQQIQSLIGTIQRFITQLPKILSEISNQVYVLGPFEFDLRQFDLTAMLNQLLTSAQAVLSQLGGLVGTLATSTISVVGYVIFILLIAYFLLIEGGQVRENIVSLRIPGYERDVHRMVLELSRILDIYLRSQILIIILVIFSYILLMSVLGMRFAVGIAIMAGFARLVPYLGPFITWTTAGLVAFFQTSNPFNLPPWGYTILVIGLALLLDQVFDQYIQPRLMGQSLGIHPAAVLVAAIVAYQWLGIIGLVLAAPVLASVSVVFRYALRKLLELDPWPEPENDLNIKTPQDRLFYRLRAWWRLKFRR